MASGVALASPGWTQFQSDEQNTGSKSNVYGPQTSNPVVNFTANLDSSAGAGAVVDSNGNVYVGDSNGKLYKYDSAGNRQWTKSTQLSGTVNVPAIDSNGNIYITTRGGQFAKYGPAGTKAWLNDVGGTLASPTLTSDDSNIYFGNTVGTMYKYDSQGREVANVFAAWSINSPPAVITSTGEVYASDYFDTKIYKYSQSPSGFSKETGLALNNNGRFSPTIDSNGDVYAADDGGEFYKFSSDTLEYNPGRNGVSVPTSTAIGKNNMMYLVDSNGNLEKRDMGNGAQKWSISLNNPVSVSSPAVSDGGTVYVGDDNGNLHAVDSDGTLNWTKNLGTETLYSPALHNGQVYVSSADNNVYVVEGPESSVSYSSPSVSPSSLYAGSSAEGKITVDNSGGAEGTYNVSISDNGTVQHWRNGTIAAGNTKTVSLNATLYSPGDHTIKIEGGSKSASQSVTVKYAWSKFGYNNTGVSSNDETTGVRSKPVTKWKVDLGGTWPVYSSPAVVNDTMYVPSMTGKMSAVNISTGEFRWNYTGVAGTDSSPAVYNNQIILSGGDKKLYSINKKGNKQWSTPGVGDYISSDPVVANDTVYFGSNNNRLHAVNVTNGEFIWNFTKPGNDVATSPAVVDNTVYVGSDDGYLYAVHANNGSQKWKANASEGGEVISSPAVYNGTVFVGTKLKFGSGSEKLTAVNASTGEFRWNFTEPSNTVPSSPAVYNGTVYAGSYDDNIYAVDESTGTKVWKTSMGSNVQIQNSPTVVNGTVYISSTVPKTSALDASTGEFRWNFTKGPDGDRFSSPAVVDGTVYIGTNNDTTYAIESNSDTAAPNITNYTATNPSSQDIKVEFETNESLSTIKVNISGAETGTLNTADFNSTSGTVNATYTGSSDGSYTAKLIDANDSSGNNGSSGESSTVSITTITETVSSCTEINSGSRPSDGNVTITSDITKTSGEDCITVKASNLTLYGNGHTVKATHTATGSAINVTGGQTNVTVKNLTTTGKWLTGIHFNNTNQSTITDVDAVNLNRTNQNAGTAGKGIWIQSPSFNNTVSSSNVSGNKIYGIHIQDSDNN
ncbi:MAG: PQQ-binding-like beta-propeller repeat protein, partial [Halobacteria archaeon]